MNKEKKEKRERELFSYVWLLTLKLIQKPFYFVLLSWKSLIQILHVDTMVEVVVEKTMVYGGSGGNGRVVLHGVMVYVVTVAEVW